MLIEDLECQLVFGVCVASDQLRGLADRLLSRELVVRKARQPVRQEVPLDPCQGGDAFDIAEEAAVALRNWLPVGEKSLHGYVDMAELARHPGSSADDA